MSQTDEQIDEQTEALRLVSCALEVAVTESREGIAELVNIADVLQRCQRVLMDRVTQMSGDISAVRTAVDDLVCRLQLSGDHLAGVRSVNDCADVVDLKAVPALVVPLRLLPFSS